MKWINQLFRKAAPPKTSFRNIPRHIAIIMDGNGRWAKKRGLPRIAGHRQGVEALKKVMDACGELGIKYLTVYAFSTENWDRPKDEVDFLMNLFSETIDKELKKIKENKVWIRFFGRLNAFPKHLREKISRASRQTEGGDFCLNVMVNYGGRAEIVDASKQLAQEVKDGRINLDQIDDVRFSKKLYLSGIPDPDLLIRTAGEMRISNFLLWEIAYAEFWVTQTLWPDFRKEDLYRAIADYNKRERKFGRV